MQADDAAPAARSRIRKRSIVGVVLLCGLLDYFRECRPRDLRQSGQRPVAWDGAVEQLVRSPV
jgi:hypothetical protein